MISEPELRRLAEELAIKQKRKESLVSEMMRGASERPAVRWLARRGMEQLFTEEEIGRKALAEIVSKMKKRRIGAQIADLKKQMRLADLSGDTQKVLAIQRQKAELEKEITDTELAFDKGRVAD